MDFRPIEKQPLHSKKQTLPSQNVSAPKKKLSPSAEIEQKLTTLAKEALTETNFETKIKEIQSLKKQQGIKVEQIKEILVRNGFKIEDADKISMSTWNHGDPLSEAEAELMLKDAPKGTWLLRFSQDANEYIISRKSLGEASGEKFEHISQSGLTNIDSIENVLKGFSFKYSIRHMLLNNYVLEENFYNMGKISGKEAKAKLDFAPIGTWLLRYSESQGQCVFTMKISASKVRHYIIDENYNKDGFFDFKQLFQIINQRTPKNVKLKFSNNLGEINPIDRTVKQTEAVVTRLFINEIANNPEEKKRFEQSGYAKVSRAAHKKIPHSYIIRNLGVKKEAAGNPLSTNPNYDIKIYQVVHGAKGVLGVGGMKIAKYIRDIETGDKLAKSKFKNYNASQIAKKFPELLEIAKLTKGMPYVTELQYMTLPNSFGEERSFVISEHAKTDFAKLILKNNLSIETKKRYILHLLTGLAALHDKKIAHRDIKPANINIIEDKTTHEDSANLADLDFATRKDKPSNKGTPLYCAPEILKGKNKNNNDLLRGDVYSLGSTLYELFHGTHLWYDPDDESAADMLFKQLPSMSIRKLLETFPEPIKNTLDHLLWEMMHPDPSKRPTALQAKEKFIELLQES
jgi:serine/threonine protein kinase